jgi:hypothetical protein
MFREIFRTVPGCYKVLPGDSGSCIIRHIYTIILTSPPLISVCPSGAQYPGKPADRLQYGMKKMHEYIVI